MKKLLYTIPIILAALNIYPEDLLGQQVFKCIQPDGSIVFSDTLCGDNSESIYVESDQSGISTNQSYEMPISDRAAQNREARNSESNNVARVQREAQREYDRMIKDGYNSRAATRAASIVMSKADNPSGAKAQREFNRMIDAGYNSQAAERAANVILGQPGKPSVVEPIHHPNPSHALVIPSSRSGVYVPTSPEGKQYIDPNGGICNREGSNLNCSGAIKPTNGVVVEPPN